MSILLRWFRKRFEERQLREDLKAREIERQIQLEQLDRQQAQSLCLKLCELHRTMDPLIAAQIYNNQFCPFSRLPEELLLHVLDFLADDPVTLHCLKLVSRTFLRLLSSQSDIWRDEWYICPETRTRARTAYLKTDLKLQFRPLLQRDGRCDNCRRWNDAYALCSRQPFDDCKFEQRYRSKLYHKLYCKPCDSHHDVCQFSTASQQAWEHPGKKRCLGQQGSVQLCEHVHITWASITAHIENWRQQHRGGGDWQACLDSFNIECHDSSHDARCTASEAPTWPRARLRTATSPSSRHIVVLNLEWAPHGRIDGLALTADGRVPAPELRAVFQRIRQLGPADTLYPPCRPGALPEMACISASSPFVYYKTTEDDETPPLLASCPPLLSDRWQLSHYFKRSLQIDYGSGLNGRKLVVRPHFPRGGGDTDISLQCLVVSYEKDIMVCETTDMLDPAQKIIPNDHWLHAMDTKTYPHPQAIQIRPQCRDETCVNYYRRRKDCCVHA